MNFEQRLNEIMTNIKNPKQISDDQILYDKLIQKSIIPTPHGFRLAPEEKLSKKELIQYKNLYMKKMLNIL